MVPLHVVSARRMSFLSCMGVATTSMERFPVIFSALAKLLFHYTIVLIAVWRCCQWKMYAMHCHSFWWLPRSRYWAAVLACARFKTIILCFCIAAKLSHIDLCLYYFLPASLIPALYISYHRMNLMCIHPFLLLFSQLIMGHKNNPWKKSTSHMRWKVCEYRFPF